MASIASAKGSGFRRHGPIIFAENSDERCPTKLLAFCKKSFPYMSKNGLQKCFLAGNVFVNDVPVRCGHEDEYKILRHHDKVEIVIDLDAADALIIAATHLDVLHIQNGCAVIAKVSGESAAFDKGLDKALKSKLWGGRRKRECQLLYHLEKGCSGICIVAETAEHLSKLRSLCCTSRHVRGASQNNLADDYPGQLDVNDSNHESDSAAPCNVAETDLMVDQEPFLELTYRCIICGIIGEVNELAFIETGHKDYPIMEATVLRISRCRSKGFISLVDIRVTFDSARMGLATVSECCHSDFFAEYDEDCNDGDGVCDGDGDGCDSNSDNDDNDNDYDYEVKLELKEEEEEEEGNTSYTTRIIDAEKRGCEVPVCPISTIAFTVDNIKKPATAADYRYLYYPTLRIRTIKRALSLCGHQIVGDGGAVKSAKGLFACVVSVTIFGISSYDFQSSILSSDKDADIEKDKNSSADKLLTICVEDPKKFAKLMVKEQELWESAQQRDNEVMIAWQALSLQHSADIVEDFESISFQESLQSVGDNNNNITDGRTKIDETNTTCNSNANNLRNQNSHSSVVTRFKSIDEMRSAMASGMPVEYVLGEATFCGLKFYVNKDVMVPRKSSEVLVMEAIKVITNNMLSVDKDADRFHRNDEVYKQSNQMKCQTGTLEIIENQIQVHDDNRSDNNEYKNNDISRYDSKSLVRQKKLRVLDIGTGSGCLLLSCLTNLNSLYRHGENSERKCKTTTNHTDTTTHTIIGTNIGMNMNININRDINYSIEGVGIDLSEAALQVAQANAHSLGLQDSTFFKILDFTNLTDLIPNMIHSVDDTSSLGASCELNSTDNDNDTIQKHVESSEQSVAAFNLNEKHFGPYDVILCNPPYSSKRDTTRLSKACREHEPSLALFSPNGPLSAYRTLAIALTACEAKKKEISTVGNIKTALDIGLFKKNAHLFLEVGHGQALPVQKVLNKLDFLTFIGIAKDHKDIDRCLMYKYNEK